MFLRVRFASRWELVSLRLRILLANERTLTLWHTAFSHRINTYIAKLLD